MKKYTITAVMLTALFLAGCIPSFGEASAVPDPIEPSTSVSKGTGLAKESKDAYSDFLLDSPFEEIKCMPILPPSNPQVILESATDEHPDNSIPSDAASELPAAQQPKEENPSKASAETKPPATEPVEEKPQATEPPCTELLVTEPPETTPPATEVLDTEPPETTSPAIEVPDTESPETVPPATEAPETEAPREQINTRELESYGRRYAASTYGYNGNPNCNPSTNAGYFPGVRVKVTTMEEGYAAAMEAVDYQHASDVAMGREISVEIDGVKVRRNINLYFQPTDDPQVFILWCYYGGEA